MKPKYPRVFKVANRKVDDQYHLCNNTEDILNAALQEYNSLRELHLLWDQEKPDPDRYGNVTDEMIDNAPSAEVESALRSTRIKREQWLDGSPWERKSLKYAQRMYSFFRDAEKGDRTAAYHYLTETELMTEITLNRHD